jgi:hypothetical protein
MPLGRRRPLARAAVVGGGAYLAGKHVANKQAAQQDQAYQEGQQDASQQYQEQAPPQQYAEPAPQYAPPAPAPAAPPAGGGMAEELAKLKSLFDSGALTADEYAAAKQSVIQGG